MGRNNGVELGRFRLMKMTFPLTIFSIFIGAIVLFALTPIFIGSTINIEERTNDNVGWARFNYSTGTTASVEYTIDDGDITIGGPAPQSGTASDMILWADNNLSVYLLNGSAYYIGKNGGTVSNGSLSDNFTISKLSNAVRISDNGNTYNFPASSWAYIPNANGGYGSFLNGQSSKLTEGTSPVFVGGLLDVITYNNINSSGYDLVIDVDRNGDNLAGADWVKNTEAT